MKYACTVISVVDINAARKFYEELFGLDVRASSIGNTKVKRKKIKGTGK